MTPFDPKWPAGHVQRCGLAAEVLCSDLLHYSGLVVVARVTLDNGLEATRLYRQDGRLYDDGDSPCDLLNREPEEWVGLYERTDVPGCVHMTNHIAAATQEAAQQLLDKRVHSEKRTHGNQVRRPIGVFRLADLRKWAKGGRS